MSRSLVAAALALALGGVLTATAAAGQAVQKVGPSGGLGPVIQPGGGGPVIQPANPGNLKGRTPQQLNADLAAVKAREAQLKDAQARGALTPEQVQAEQRRLQDQLAAIQRLLDQLKQQQDRAVDQLR